MDSEDLPYVVDRSDKRIQVIAMDGRRLGPRKGLGTPWNKPYDRRESVLWMCDGDLGRISKLSLDGSVLGWLGTDGSEPGQLRQVDSTAADSKSAIRAAETVNGRIQEIDLGE